MNIRQAEPSDSEAIIKFDHVAQCEASRLEFIRRVVQFGHAFVAVVNGFVAAYIVLEYSFFGNCFIPMLYVHPDHRRQGIGSALMRHVEQNCKTIKLFTSTNQSNVRMQHLLDKLSYQPSGIIENLDEGDPELIYFKPLQRKAV